MARHHKEDDGPETLVGISFDDNFRAQEFLTAATRLASQGHLILKDAVVVTKSLDGQVTVRETSIPPKRSAISGDMWTGLIGLLVGGPARLAGGAAVGAGAGAVAAKVVDLGIPDEWVNWFRQAAEPGRRDSRVVGGESRSQRARRRNRSLLRRGNSSTPISTTSRSIASATRWDSCP